MILLNIYWIKGLSSVFKEPVGDLSGKDIMNSGLFYAALAYIIWGLLPVYWKTLQSVSSLEILCHRMIWSVIFMIIIIFLQGKWLRLLKIRKRPRMARFYLISASLLTINWFTYVYAVNSEHIVEASLGYFINPLIYVLLGLVFLKEKLRKLQVIAILIASAGVLYLTVIYGSFPWIALVLAFTFGFYGLIRKTGGLDAVEGLTLETMIMLIPAVLTLLFLKGRTGTELLVYEPKTIFLLVLVGPATALPLLLFAEGARRITLTSLGILQYIAPTIQLLIGVLIYKEEFVAGRFLGFSIIWLALAIYTGESINRYKKNIRQKGIL